ncbi:MAG: diacylglycerol kinase family protein [Clostridia bacterium]|nr:diacylglycerol kinase family protein [Clostridia bacterium]
MKYYVLYNPYAGNNTSESETKTLSNILTNDELVFIDMTGIESYSDFFADVDENAEIIISGGDGTLNRFINDTDGLNIKNKINYYATGSGNDFLRDIGGNKGEVINIDKYICDLPVVEINGKSYRVLNGVGYGIDGYCCEVGDEYRKIPGKKINYTAIAIKGLLFHYKPKNAVVTVDGVRREFKKVWLAPTMNGRFYGGGMIPTPNQNRLDPNKKLSVLLYHNAGKLKALITFPSIFKGEHIKKENMCKVLTGSEIKVEFDKPSALQIDGETILGVTEYTMKIKSPVTVK